MHRWTRASYILSVLTSISLVVSVHVYAAGPTISALTPNSGAIGATITIIGNDLGASQSTSIVTFNGTQATTVSRWSSGSVTAIVPVGAATGNVVVTVNGQASNAVPFVIVPATTTSSVSHLKDSPHSFGPRMVALFEPKMAQGSSR
jgi:hypothetical protein